MKTKLVTLEKLSSLLAEHRADGKRIVWTNGCFDLLHAGHALSLDAARELGDLLVVGVNTDASVTRLKGDFRPLISQEQRIVLLSAFAAIDYLVLFDTDDCVNELESLQPDVYAQGGGYTLDTINQDERRVVEAYGGEIAFLPSFDAVSTSLVLQKIRRTDPERIVSAAFGIIRDNEGGILLVANRYTDGRCWGLPGGGQKRGERLEETVIRECREEIGVTVEVAGYRGVIERIDPAMRLHLILHLYELSIVSGEIEAQNTECIEEARFFTTQQIRSEPEKILGRKQFLLYLEDPETYPPYIFMGPGEE